MRTSLGLGVVLCTCVGCTAPATVPAPPVADLQNCRTMVGQAQIDGTMQTITGHACRQPDGTWLVMPDDDMAAAMYYAAWPWYVDYAYPWWPPAVVGVGGSFVFIDHFHHFHHGDHGDHGHGFPDHGHPGMYGMNGMNGMGAHAGGVGWVAGGHSGHR